MPRPFAMADIAITAANFIPSANASLTQGIAGASITRGQPLYLDTGTNTYKVFDASNVSKNAFAGFACEDAASGQPILVCTKDPALQLGGTVASGDTVWGTATGVTKTFADLVTTWKIWVIGICTDASNTINFSPVAGGIK